MIISYSEVAKKQTCDRAYYYAYTLGLSPVEDSEALATGNKGHKLLQHFYTHLSEGKSKEEAWKLTELQAVKDAKLFRGLSDASLMKAWVLVANYIRETDFTANAILIENRFLLPASRLSDDPAFADIQIGFTPDVVFERKGGFIDVEDSKFVQRAWSSAKINRCPQSKLYKIFLGHLGYKVSRASLRFFNVQTAKITTSYKTTTPLEDKILVRDFLEGVREVSAFRNQPEVDKPLAARTMNYSTCQYCFFKYPCDLEAQGKDATRSLDSEFERNKYSYAN